MSNGNISVDPHITQYTVYITDSYNTGDVVKANVTETQFTFNNQGNVLCPVYRVSAWNAGGEGQLSEPVQESTPQGKQAKDNPRPSGNQLLLLLYKVIPYAS